jgi:pilus assembly protein Flp/PilA
MMADRLAYGWAVYAIKATRLPLQFYGNSICASRVIEFLPGLSAKLIVLEMPPWSVGAPGATDRDAMALKKTTPGEYIMSKFVARFMKDESGATAIEYGLIACLISVACITVMGSIGSNLNATFTTVKTSLS